MSISGYKTNYTTGTILTVDGTNGNDTKGARGGFAYKTIAAANSAAQSGDVIWVLPGTYNESGITITNGVTISGVSSNAVIVEKTGVSADTTIFTMGASSRLEDISINLTSTGHHTLKGVVWPGTTSSTAKIRRAVITINNSTASDAGTSNVYGVHSTGTGQPTRDSSAIRATTIKVDSAGAGAKRCLLNDAANNFYTRDTNYRCMRTGTGAGTYIAVETNHASAVVGVDTGSIEGSPTADISQTLGTIELGSVVFVNGGANGKSFTPVGIGTTYVFADPGSIAVGTRYLRPGTAAASATEVPVRLGKKVIIYGLSIHAVAAPGLGITDVFKVRKNGVDTSIAASLIDLATDAVDTANSVEFIAGDDLSISATISAGSALSDVVVTVDAY